MALPVTSELNTCGMKAICSYLKKQKLRAWHLRYTLKESREVYAINGQWEAVRRNTVANHSLLLHRHPKHKTGGTKNVKKVIGESKADFQILGEEWRQVVDDTITRAGLIENPEYDLPRAWEVEPRKANPIYDKALDHDIAQELTKVNQTLSELNEDDLLGCRLASYEIFFEKYHTKIENSHGLGLRLPSTKILWDFVLISKNKEAEINRLSQRRFIKDFDWVNSLREEARQLIDLQEARLPPTGTFPVVMADEALDTIFDYFTKQADGNALYHKYSSFEEGASVYKDQKEALEPLTITTEPMLSGGMRSGFFEELGYPLRRVLMIEKGVLKNFTIGGKLSHLLDKPVTSSLSNTLVETGKTPYHDFLEDGVFELLRFSTFHPNPITGAFSGEIRLGYWHKGGQKIPIKGGSVSGVSQNHFLRARLSREAVQRESYYGPKGIYFEDLTLAGE